MMWKQQNICLFVFTFIIHEIATLDDRPVILTKAGNLEIAAAPGKNIKLNVNSGGKLLVQDKDISAMIEDMSTSLETLQQCKIDSKNALSKITKFEDDVSSDGLLTRLNALERLTNNTNRLVFLVSRPMRRRINNNQKRLLALMRTLSINECNSNPCQHGGTCQDMYNTYSCLCPPNWEGGNCDLDVNECDAFKGTELGCQNGAKCVNTLGDYKCQCTDGWFGIHCTKKTQDCNNSKEVCGHGTCIPLTDGFTCICDQGWKTDGTKPSCTVDVNECDAYHPPCSSNPPVKCVNLPGTFYCGHCPAGYTGNGFYCSDINECEIMNGGCSMYPMVQCINIPGSKMCGRCPPGYTGNGVVCLFQGACGVSNGGCHPMAQCKENPRISSTYVECVCPPGYGGDGYGPSGCLKGINVDSCASNPCQYGTCTSTENGGYSCNCTTKYTGRNCDIRKDACFSNPCQNGGTCNPFAFSFFCTCAAGFSGPYCQNNVLQCGQALGKQGQLTYPPADFQFNRNSQISCAVRLKAPITKVLNVTIHGVYVQDCNHNYLQIHDGKDTGSPLIGRFCDSQLKNGSTIISFTDTLYVWLKGDAQAPKPFMNISWTSIDPVCGSVITVTEPGTFKSPGSPQAYPPGRDCFWHLKAPLNKRIKFTFFHLDIGNNSDCKQDKITFNEGLEPSDNYFFQRCKTGIIEPVLSPSNEVTVHLHTFGSYTGFLIHYSLIEGAVGCGGVYTYTSGTISSLPFNEDADGSTCEYKIQLPFHTRIRLHFQAFKGSGVSNACTSDSYTLAIYEGDNINSPLVGRYCGSTKPSDLMIVDKQALIVYKPTDNTRFTLDYTTVCGGTYMGESATIQSDNYPNIITIEESLVCIYVIMRPPNDRIKIEFNGLNIGNGTNWDCTAGYLEISEGPGSNSTKLRKYCSLKPDETIFSSSSLVTIKYHIKSSAVTGGFSLNYKTLTDGECGGLRTEKFGSVESPKDLSSYEHGLNCTWLLSAPAGHIIEINWLSFNLEESYNCIYDYVQIFDNSSVAIDDVNPKSTEMGKYCGNRLPPTMTTTSNVATVFFKIDTLNNYDGFYFTYRFITAANVCGGHYFAPSGIIRSPMYPLTYPDNRNCIWIITVPQGQQIQLNFTSFNIELSGSCRYDYLLVLNGGSLMSPQIGKYCGRTVPKKINSHTNQMYIQFVSDKTKSGPGFELRWTTTATGCGGTLSSPSGSIISPNYPHPYGANAECFWKIAVSAGSKIQAVFADLDLEYMAGCFTDYVDFYDGIDTMSKKLGTYCKLTGHSPLVLSSGNHMTIKFHSDINHQGRGFQLQYSSLCKTNVTGFGGVIENPNYPTPSARDTDCEWEITVPEGNKINLTFSNFNIEIPSFFTKKEYNCERNYLEIAYQEEYEERQSLGKFCELNLPDENIYIKSNKAFVKFHYGLAFLKSTFRLEWVISGCGGFFNRPDGVIQTPNYPKAYPENTVCNWHLQTEFGKSIEVTFGQIDMEQNRNCDMDFIKVFNGPDDTYPEVSKFCHTTDKPTVITSTGREMFIIFRSDVSFSGKGFQANYKTVDTKCGGRLTLPSGVLHSPNYPNNYDKNDTCEWLIEVQENHLIELVFTSVDLLNVCESTYIKVYDGPTAAYPLLAMICGHNKPDKLISRTNHLYVELVTHALLTTKGFMAKYSTACGARIQTQGSGIIDFGVETLISTNVTNCTWTIIAENPSQHVLLTFTKYQNSHCYYGDSDALVIYDGENHNSSRIGGYCQKAPGVVRSSGNMLHIEIPENAPEFKFSAKYSVVDSSCGGTYSTESAELSTPGYPNSYPIDIQCEWTINAGQGNELSLSFTTFDLVKSDNCNEDYLEIRENNRSGRIIGTFCGDTKPINVTAKNTLWMYFKSERPSVGVETTTGKGFLADFAITTFVELNQENGTIVSPLYPDTLMSDKQYKWQITAPANYNIYIEFDEMIFDMGGNGDYCFGDTLTVFDGSSDDMYLAQLCSPSQPIKTTSNVATLVFNSPSGGLFKLRWKQMNSMNISGVQCGSSNIEVLHKETTTLSYEFPKSLMGRKKCAWTYNTEPGRHLHVAFNEILSTSKFCVIDAVWLYGGNGYGVGETISQTFSSLGFVCNASMTHQTFETQGDSLKVEHSVFFYSPARNRSASKFSLNVTDVCGGSIKKSNGLIVVNGPDEPNLKSHLECKWRIEVPTGKIISINLVSNFTQDKSACETKVVVRNGHYKDSPIISTYCGERDKRLNIITTGNKAYITFIGNYTDSIKIRYRATSTTDCDNTIDLTDLDNSAIITSPNYPNAPEMYAECTWLISVPNGEAVRIDFLERFDLQKSIDCVVDGVEIRDGATSNSRLIGKYCAGMPGTIKSLTNRVYIKYYTNSVDPRNGFKANISIAFCGGTIRGIEGSIMSPGFKHKNSYPLNASCDWELWAPQGHTMNLTFNFFDIPRSAQLQIVDAQAFNNSEVELYKYKYFKPSKPIRSGTNKVIVRFLSGKSGPYEGFLLTFAASVERCGGELNTPFGTITSPNYPSPAKAKQTCEWLIRVPEGRRVKLVFNDLDLSNDSDSRQGLSCYSGDIFGSNILFFSNKDTSDKVIRSSDNIMKIYFWSYSDQNNRGFKASYTSDEPSVCAGALEDSGRIRRPLEDKFTCSWVPKIPMSKTQTLAFYINMNVTNAPKAACNFGRNSVYLTQLGRGKTEINVFKDYLKMYCKSTTETDIIRTLLPYSTIAANQKNNQSYIDFDIKYKVFNCGGQLSASDGVISPPQGSAECAWRLVGIEGEQVTISFNDFNLNDCDKSYLLVYNGININNPLVGKYCGSNTPTTITSQRHYLWIEYHNDDSKQNSFNITYKKESKNCGGIYHMQSSRMQSPMYPSNYDNNEECLWELRAQNGFHIELTFTDRFQLEEADGCGNDFVSVYEDAVNEKQAVKYCGRTMPPIFKSTGNLLYVLFKTNEMVTGSGFSATWKWGCGGDYNATNKAQYITSPGYPDKYTQNLRCEYIIRAPGKYIKVSFDDFRLENGSISCIYDRLITGNIAAMRSSIRRNNVFCGSKLPNVLRFYSVANLTFITDSWVNERGFKLNYQIDDCGGNITQPTLLEATSSQNVGHHSLYYSAMRKCTWSITAPKNKRIVVKFTNVKITYNMYCYSQFVSAMNGGKKMAVLCGDLPEDSLPTIQSNNNSMTLLFQYFNFGRISSFKALVDFVYGPDVGCGGYVNLTTASQTITFNPPGYNYDCIWHIETGVDYTIKFNFDVASLPKDQCKKIDNNVYATESQKCCVYYEMRDGNTSLADVIFNECDLQGGNPVSYTSSGNFAQLRIVANNKELKIPKITILRELSVCGHTHLTPTNQSQYIQTPNFPLTYPKNLRCVWRLTTKYINSIHLKFEEFDLNGNKENLTECGALDRLEMVDKTNKAFHLNYDLVWKRKRSKWEMTKMDSLIGHHTFCSATDKNYEFVSTDNYLQLSFYSDSKEPKAGKGFKIEYKIASCNRTYSGLSGRIARTWQPGNCTAVITAPKNYTIALFFSNMHIFQVSCNIRRFEIFDGADTQTPVTKLCGMQTAKPVFSTTNELVIKLKNTLRYGTYTSEMTYIASDQGRGCGGELYMFKGTFTSPLYPNPPTSDILCRWNVRVPMGLQLAFNFKWMDIKGNCEDNYVKLTDANQPEAASQVYCARDTPAIFIAASGAITLEYKSGPSNTGTGWRAAFMAITSDMDLKEFQQ